MFDKAIELNKNSAHFYSCKGLYNFNYSKGVVLKKIGRFDEAVATYDEAININPKDANLYT